MPSAAVAEVVMPANEEQQYYATVDQVIDPKRPLFVGIDVSEAPHFTVSEAAKFFFKRSSHWIRLQENLGLVNRTLSCRNCGGNGKVPGLNPNTGRKIMVKCFECQGRKTVLYRVAVHRTAGGARYYDLADIEDLAHALFENRVIDEEQLRQALGIARLQGRLWNYL